MKRYALDDFRNIACEEWTNILSSILADGSKSLGEIVEACRRYWAERKGTLESSRLILRQTLQTIGAFGETDRARRAFQTAMDRLGIPLIRPTGDERRRPSYQPWRIETNILAEALRDAGISPRWNDPAQRAMTIARLVERIAIALPDMLRGLEKEAVAYLGSLIHSDPNEERWWYEEAAKRLAGLVELKPWQGAYGDEADAIAAVNGAVNAILSDLEETIDQMIRSSRSGYDHDDP